MTLPSRREFLARTSRIVGLGPLLPEFLARAAAADRSDERSGRPVLVVLQLAGGNDGLNTLVPYACDDYYRLRPRIAVPPADVLRIDDSLGWHPEAKGLNTLLDDGHLCVVQNVGYPNPNRSHFVSQRIWDTGSADGRTTTGWLGRYCDSECRGTDPPDPLQSIAVTPETPLMLTGGKTTPICADRPERFGLTRSNRRGDRSAARNQPDGRAPHADPGSNLDYLLKTAANARVASGRIRRAARRDIPGSLFPDTPLGRDLRAIARMIASDLPTRIYYASTSGFDTHANQPPRHARQLSQTADAVGAFASALRKSGQLDRTLLLVFSEFGRRVEENASRGTDHGQAGPVFLAGGKVAPGLLGPPPRLDRLSDGDLPFQVDFRAVYATLLRRWLDVDPRPVVGPFQDLPLLRPGR